MILASANQAFLSERYHDALVLYSQAAQFIDEKLFRVNLNLCREQCQCDPIITAPKANSLSVACILDEFSSTSFSYCFTQCHLEPHCWRRQFEIARPALFFCESAWRGRDPARPIWAGQIHHQHRRRGDDNRKVLLDIISYCKKIGIPTVYWNKEDPTYHDHPTYDFAATSKHFDYVFTTDETCIDSYRRKHGIKNVAPLPFATNPHIFNPLETSRREADVTFAGGWYENHPERCRAMRSLFDSLLARRIPITIYDRYSAGSGSMNRWPDKYRPFVKAHRPHREIASVYKRSVYGLNFNTVTDSPTMFSRRVFELMSCNTLVVSNFSKGTQHLFPQSIIYPELEPDRLKDLSTDEADAMRAGALHEVLSKHTYLHRWQTVLHTIGLPCNNAKLSLTYAIIAHNNDQAFRAVEWFAESGLSAESDAQLLVVFRSESPPEERKRFEQRCPNDLAVASTTWERALDGCSEADCHPIKTTHFLLFRTDDYPAAGRVREVLLHTQYMTNRPLVISHEPSKRFRIESTSNNLALLDQAHGFAPALHCTHVYPSVYLV
jgi:spore maturation protein CgeB